MIIFVKHEEHDPSTCVIDEETGEILYQPKGSVEDRIKRCVDWVRENHVPDPA